MKFVNAMMLALIFCLSLSFVVIGQTNKPTDKPKYDADLAKKLGGDERGMKIYVLVLLRTGKKDADFVGKARDEIFAGHMSNIGRLAGEGKLAVAGPFEPNDKGYRGLYILNVTSLEDAQKLVDTDPAVKAGILSPDMTLWYGSASLLATPEIHKTITKPKQ